MRIKTRQYPRAQLFRCQGMRKGYVGSLFFIRQNFHRCRENATQCFPSPLVLVPSQARQLRPDYAKCVWGLREGECCLERAASPGEGNVAPCSPQALGAVNSCCCSEAYFLGSLVPTSGFLLFPALSSNTIASVGMEGGM